MNASNNDPIINVEQFEHHKRRDAGLGENYKGLPIFAAPGLHAHVFERALSHLTPGGHVLDLAAGSGAMSLRLRDHGFSVTAVELVASNFAVPDVTVHSLDLNGAFSEQLNERFDAICALEIIEHLENPRHFLRQCRALLKPGGVLVLSTPNIDSTASKAMFLRESEFLWFTEASYQREGHITPIARGLLKRATRELGFETLEFGSFGNSMRHLERSPRLHFVARVLKLLDTSPEELRGEVSVAIYRMPAVT